MIQTFLFDMGGVLVKFSHKLMCEQMGALCGRSGSEIEEFLIRQGLQFDMERGLLSEGEFHSRFEDLVDQRVDHDQLLNAASDIFELNEPVIPVLDQLKQQGHRLILLSNTSISHFEFIQRQFDLLHRFDDFVLSYEVGSLKPEVDMYKAALKAAGCEASRCFYTDDVEVNIAAGRDFGFQSELFTDVESLKLQLNRYDIVI